MSRAVHLSSTSAPHPETCLTRHAPPVLPKSGSFVHLSSWPLVRLPGSSFLPRHFYFGSHLWHSQTPANFFMQYFMTTSPLSSFASPAAFHFIPSRGDFHLALPAVKRLPPPGAFPASGALLLGPSSGQEARWSAGRGLWNLGSAAPAGEKDGASPPRPATFVGV